jgi:hypothetical protein
VAVWKNRTRRSCSQFDSLYFYTNLQTYARCVTYLAFVLIRVTRPAPESQIDPYPGDRLSSLSTFSVWRSVSLIAFLQSFKESPHFSPGFLFLGASLGILLSLPRSSYCRCPYLLTCHFEFRISFFIHPRREAIVDFGVPFSHNRSRSL